MNKRLCANRPPGIRIRY
jgi:hypothetical protein